MVREHQGESSSRARLQQSKGGQQAADRHGGIQADPFRPDGGCSRTLTRHPYMALQLYDLAGAESERRFSPYCWRIKLALMHKGLPFDTIPWRFTEKNAIAFSGQGRVPVLIDGDQVVFDSWTIANYLEARYPDCPSLFRGDGGRAVTRFVNVWAD